VAKLLDGLRVLIVEDDPDSGELLEMALNHAGANVTLAATGAAAMTRLALRAPDVLLCDLNLPDGSGLDWLGKFRTLPLMAGIPAIALSGKARSTDREESLAAGFEKHLTKPAPLADIIGAINALARRNEVPALLPMLKHLASTTGCRYASLLRFADDKLVSVWTHDRDAPHADAFPIDLPIAASYCILVRQARDLVVIEDATTDARAAGHPKQHQLATYVAAPVFSGDGTMFGTLCSYDAEPRIIDVEMRAAVAAAAREIETTLLPAYPTRAFA